MKANVFSIRKFHINNGEGFRTIVFFKGCPLRCTWCPERLLSEKPIQILWDQKKCFYGHLCEIHCPTGSIRFENGVLEFTNDTCTGCRSCIRQCPSRALEFADRLMGIDEIMEILIKDRNESPNYEGVTLAGGEVMEQAEFAIELLKRCRAEGISSAVETSGYASPLLFSKVARFSDSLIFHLRHYDNKRHVKYTGVSPGKILENLDTAVSIKTPVTVRIPVVPGINSSPSDAEGFAKLLKEHRVEEVQLLLYRQTREKQYEEILSHEKIDSISDRLNIKEYAAVLRRAGLTVTY